MLLILFTADVVVGSRAFTPLLSITAVAAAAVAAVAGGVAAAVTFRDKRRVLSS